MAAVTGISQVIEVKHVVTNTWRKRGVWLYAGVRLSARVGMTVQPAVNARKKGSARRA